MTHVSQKTFEARCRSGEWECMAEPTRSGYAEVRVAATGKRRMVQVG